MANIDNTVLCEIMVRLFGCTREALWQKFFGGVDGMESNENMLRRFSTGENYPTGNIPWWPKKSKKECFEKGIRTNFVDYATEIGINETCSIIERVCQEFHISGIYTINITPEKTPTYIIENIIKYYVSESNYKPKGTRKTQRWLVENGYFSVNDNLSDTKTQPELSLLEGEILEVPHPKFKTWVHPSNWEWVKKVSGSLDFGDGTHIVDIPYLEIFGSKVSGTLEFVQKQNLFVQLLEGVSAEIERRVVHLDFSAEVEKERIAAEQLGYDNHPPKMYLHSMQYIENAGYAGCGRLTLNIGQGDYLAQRVYRREIYENTTEQRAFIEILSGLRGNAKQLKNAPWASMGGGVWIIVNGGDQNRRERYVVLSFRNPKHVAEIPNCIGYSSSGSYDFADESPAKAMAREIVEELSLEAPDLEQLKLISLGVDTERYLIQFSYMWDASDIYSIDDVRRCHMSDAVNAAEQTIFFVRLEEEPLKRFLRQAKFEPGAAFSLMRLLQKNGQW